jgi:hypothetical protein
MMLSPSLFIGTFVASGPQPADYNQDDEKKIKKKNGKKRKE